MYYVVATIPCKKSDQISIWWKVAKSGYNFTYENGLAKIYGRRKTEEDVAILKEALKIYPEHTIRVEDGDI